MFHLLILILTLLLTSTPLTTPKPSTPICPSTQTTPYPTQCLAPLDALHPTQIPIGNLSALCKVQRFEKKFRDDKMDKYLKKHPVPVILGPNPKLFITDHHHMTYALKQLRYDGYVVINVHGDMRNRTEDAFWNEMRDKHWMYAYDEYGNPVRNATSVIPGELGMLRNDPYRTLASLMVYYGYIGKDEDAPEFVEFQWAQYLRSRNVTLSYNLDWRDELRQQHNVFLDAAREVRRDEARGLPGWGKGEVDVPECDLLDDF